MALVEVGQSVCERESSCSDFSRWRRKKKKVKGETTSNWVKAFAVVAREREREKGAEEDEIGRTFFFSFRDTDSAKELSRGVWGGQV